MSVQFKPAARRLNRRAFLYGVGGVGIGLPFLESAPDRSAWAADEQPTFAMFMGTANGVIADAFWPAQLGELTDLANDPNAVGILGEFADQLLVVGGLKYPGMSGGDTHGWSYPQMLTGAPPVSGSSSHRPKSTVASIDVILSPVLNPAATPPLTLYSGMKQGYIDEAMSWTAEGELRAAEGNPFVVYDGLVGRLEAGADPGVVANAVLVRRQSVMDLARDELLTFQARPSISQNDRIRLEQHFAALRDIEQSLGDIESATCTTTHLDVGGINAIQETYRQNGMVEVVAKLQLELAAFAFACNLEHVATLQSGDGLDSTRYDVPSNERAWSFHHISHQIQSDGAVGEDPLAVQAHIEIDRLRMETLAHGLRQFAAHQLLDKAVFMWANQMSDGRSGSFHNLPIIVAGNPYGRLRMGRYTSYSGRDNGELLTTIAQVLGVDQVIGTATGGLDDLLA